MKTITTILAAIGCALTLVAPAAGASEHNHDRVCLTGLDFGLSCAEGTLGHLTPTCNAQGCRVTLTFDLQVVPSACGRIGGFKGCAPASIKIVHGEETVFVPHNPQGAVTFQTPLCVSPPDGTYSTELCTTLSHVVVLPNPNNPNQMNAAVLNLLGLGSGTGGNFVLATDNVEAYEGGTLL